MPPKSPPFSIDADVFDAGLAQARADQQPAEAAADDQHLDVVVQRRARSIGFDVRIVEVVRELADYLEVLRVAVCAEALVALQPVLLAQCIGVKARRRSGLCHGISSSQI